MKKMVITLLLGSLIASVFVSPVLAEEDWATRYIDEYYRQYPPSETVIKNEKTDALYEVNLLGEIIKGRFLVPMRGIFESLGASVQYNSSNKLIEASNGIKTIKLTVGGKNAIVDGKIIELEVPVTLIGGSAFVPLRFISESLGATVNWDKDNRVATVMQNSKKLKVYADGYLVPKPQETNTEIKIMKGYIGKKAWADKTKKGKFQYWYGKNVKHLEEVTVVAIEWKAFSSTTSDYIVTVKKKNGERVYIGMDNDGSIDWANSRIESSAGVDLALEFEDPFKTYSNFSKKDWEAIQENRVVIGMTGPMVFMAWGSPESKNVTQYSWGNYEQWVYRNNAYLYFKNGKLETIQSY